MPSARYSFRTEWSFHAPIEEVAAILEDVDALSSWWPSVYLRVKTIHPGAERGVGRRVALWTKGWLPYTLKWSFTVVESNSPHGFRIAADGDFQGEGIWTLEQRGNQTHVIFDWIIEADKPLLRYGSFLLRPLFGANHRWAMEQGRASLELELRRRRGDADVPAAPAATWPHRRLAR